MSRAEWHDTSGGMRPRDQVIARLGLFAELVEYHRLGAQPCSFIPCAFLHHFANHPDNMAAIRANYGITSISL